MVQIVQFIICTTSRTTVTIDFAMRHSSQSTTESIVAFDRLDVDGWWIRKRFVLWFRFVTIVNNSIKKDLNKSPENSNWVHLVYKTEQKLGSWQLSNRIVFIVNERMSVDVAIVPTWWMPMTSRACTTLCTARTHTHTQTHSHRQTNKTP